MADSTDNVVVSLTRQLVETERDAVDVRGTPGVSVRDLDILRTRLELLHDMNDRDRREREQQRHAVHAAVVEMQRQVSDVQRDHRGIRQTVGDLAAMVRGQSAEGSAVRAAFEQLRAAVIEVRDDSRTALQQAQRGTRRAMEQMDAHARMDRDRLGATEAAVEQLGAALGSAAAHQAETRDRLDDLGRLVEAVGVRSADASEDLQRQRATELADVALLREQLAEAIGLIEELNAVSKRQAGQITRLRADLKKATGAPPPSPAKAAPKAAAKRTAKATGQPGQRARRTS